MAQYILSIDQGTTSTTVMLVDHELHVVAQMTKELAQIYPRPGWVEHDPEAIWASVIAALEELLERAALAPSSIVGIGITNQRETTIVWERQSGRPVHNAIVWQDRRTAGLCEALKAEGHESLFRARTGLVLDPYFSGTKLRWLLDEVPGARHAAEEGGLAFGTVDSYLIWRLTGGAVHVTDVSNASRTLLFNLHTLDWDAELLARLKLPRTLLPLARSSSEVYGVTRDVPGLPDGIPIAGAAGDQQAALFGQACFEAGEVKCTYGTGAFILANTGTRPIASNQGLLTTVAWKLDGKCPAIYALEGSSFVAGAAVQWLRDGLGIIRNAAEIEALARKVPDSGGVVFVPALVGLGAPHWRPSARGLIAGLTRGSTAAHLARATLEGIALQICDLAQAMSEEAGHELTSFKVDGGASANDLLMQLQADLLEMPIVRPQVTETTALGAALLAGLATKMWTDPKAILHAWSPARTFRPGMDSAMREQLLARWRTAVALA